MTREPPSPCARMAWPLASLVAGVTICGTILGVPCWAEHLVYGEFATLVSSWMLEWSIYLGLPYLLCAVSLWLAPFGGSQWRRVRRYTVVVVLSGIPAMLVATQVAGERLESRQSGIVRKHLLVASLAFSVQYPFAICSVIAAWVGRNSTPTNNADGDDPVW